MNGYGGRGDDGVCHDDSATPVRANTVDELHSRQRKPTGASHFEENFMVNYGYIEDEDEILEA
uniref:Uncharacterized protein n=1 Tax=Leersia perrieri TaxID=77586 RepID=A0A0D9XIH4_9ORYZ